MYQDEIIAEVWKNRDAYAAKHHHNLDEMLADIRKLQQKLGGQLVDRRQSTSSPSNSDIQPSSNHPNASAPSST